MPEEHSESVLFRGVVDCSGDRGKRLACSFFHCLLRNDKVISHDLSLTLLNDPPIQIAPSQTRILPIRVMQDQPFTDRTLVISVSLVSFSPCKTHIPRGHSLTMILPIVHRMDLSMIGLKATYFFATSIPTAFLVIPPKSLSEGELSSISPPILALRAYKTLVSFWPLSFILWSRWRRC